MARISGIVSHIIPAASPSPGRDRQPAADNNSEPTLAVVSTFVLGDATRPGGTAPLPDFLPGAIFGLLREQGLRTAPCSCDELLETAAGRYRGVVLCGDGPLSVVAPLIRLRQHPATALLPVVVYLHREGFALDASAELGDLLLRGWTRYADAVVESESSLAEAAAAVQRLRRISGALGALPAPQQMPARSARRLLLLRMLLTRGLVSLSPQRDPTQPLCHSYPPLDLLSGALLPGDLDGLCQLGLLERSFFERVCVCSACGDARLLFREVCAACLSADVRRGEVIHHYRCGHVAPEYSFHRGAELSCPSCGESLRHIGIDYERPASLLHCQGCDHLAAEGLTQARCLGCGQGQMADAVGERVLWSYQITPEGRGVAALGQMPVAAPPTPAEGSKDEEGP